MEQKLYPVMEIFDSIQGEGAMIGMPVTFIRFAGCNLTCPWCDTKESWRKSDYGKDMEKIAKCYGDAESAVTDLESFQKDDEVQRTILGYRWLTVEQIVNACRVDTVVFTGGEPCLQDLEPLIIRLHELKTFVCIETNGTQPTPEGADWIVCSPKPQEYTIHAKCFFNELKYVVDDNFNIDCIPPVSKTTYGSIWLQPCDYGKKTLEQLDRTKDSIKKAYELVMKYPYLRMGVQLHKIIDVK